MHLLPGGNTDESTQIGLIFLLNLILVLSWISIMSKPGVCGLYRYLGCTTAWCIWWRCCEGSFEAKTCAPTTTESLDTGSCLPFEYLNETNNQQLLAGYKYLCKQELNSNALLSDPETRSSFLYDRCVRRSHAAALHMRPVAAADAADVRQFTD